jgi:hypothetical protein
MHRRDLITAEIQKLALALTRVMGIKLEGRTDEFDVLFKETLKKEFDLDYDELLEYNQSDFDLYLNELNHPAEKLELLSNFLYFKIESFENTGENKDLAERVAQLYDFIEKKHHTFSLENLGRQKQIQQFLLS